MRLCLNMIVRDEAPVIEETLRNVVEHFAPVSWVIHDTGSTDDTPGLIEAFFASRGIPGKLIRTEWIDFAENRNRALADARGHGDYVLFFDADDLVEGSFDLPGDSCDSYSVPMKRGDTSYCRKLIVRNDGSFRWRGVIHEVICHLGESEHEGALRGCRVLSRSIGARSHNPSTYYLDAIKLAQAYHTADPADTDLLPRYAFYCANSWRDAGCPREAAHWYRERIALGGWVDEVFLSYLGLALALEEEGNTVQAREALLHGHELCPERAECLYHLCRILRQQGRYEAALIYARAGIDIVRPDPSRLFLWDSVYDYWMDFEYLFLLLKGGKPIKSLPQYARFTRSDAPADLRAWLED